MTRAKGDSQQAVSIFSKTPNKQSFFPRQAITRVRPSKKKSLRRHRNNIICLAHTDAQVSCGGYLYVTIYQCLVGEQEIVSDSH